MDLFERFRRSQLLTDAQLQAARQRVLATREDWATAVCALKLAPEREVVRLLATHTGWPGVELARSALPLSLLSLAPEEVLRTYLFLPLVDAQGGLIVAMANPDDRSIAAELGFMTGRKILPHVAVPGLLKAAIDSAYSLLSSGEAMWRGKEMWSTHPDPIGRAAVIRPEPQADALPEEDEPIVVGEELPPEDDEAVVTYLDQGFAEAELPARAAPAPAQDSRTTRSGGAGAGKVALVVDDDEAMRGLVKKLLEPFGCALLESGDGKEALALARESRPDVVVLDAMLPSMHGFEVCRAIKGDAAMQRTAVLMMSGVHTGWKVGIDVAEVYGADGFFEKPFAVEAFTRALRRCLVLGGGGEEDSAKARRQASLATCREAAARARAGRTREAIDLLRAAAEKDPYSAEPQFYLGQMYQAAKDPYRAIAALERAVDLRPDLEAPLTLLGELYRQQGFKKTAQQVLERAAEVCPDGVRRAALEAKARALKA